MVPGLHKNQAFWYQKSATGCTRNGTQRMLFACGKTAIASLPALERPLETANRYPDPVYRVLKSIAAKAAPTAALLPHLFEFFVAQFTAQDLADVGFGQFVTELDVPGALVAGQLLGTEGADFLFRQ